MAARLALLTASVVLSVLPLAQEVRSMPTESAFTVWVADPLVKILPDNPAPAKPPARVIVDAVRNEYESAQVVVTARADIDKLSVKVSSLEGPSRVAPQVEARFLGFVPVRKGTPNTPPEDLIVKPPADVPDPILDARSVAVSAGKNQPIWLTVRVPKSAEPGTYTGKVDVLADGESAAVPISVTVHPVVLPDERTLYLTNWFSTGNIASGFGLERWSEAYWKMLEAYARLMAEHRQNVVITPMFELITGRDDGKGNLSFDFSRFDRWVELFKKAGVIGVIEGGHLGGRGEWEAKDFQAGRPTILNPDGSAKPYTSVTVTSDEQRQFLSQYLPALQKHLEEKGWIGQYVQHLADEPIPANAESYKKLASFVREFAPKIRIIDASMCTEIAGAIDIWVPQPQEYEAKRDFFLGRQKAGDDVWFYTCLAPTGKYMNRFIDYQLIKTRLLHWMNFKYGLTGYLHWGFNFWAGDPFKDIDPTYPPGDSHISYPGKRGPLSSIRLSALRDGVEDFELLKMLEKKDPKKARAICDSVVRTMTDYTRDPVEFGKARMKLIRALGFEG